MLVDSHAHIDGPEYEADRAEVLARARAAGVCAILNIGTGDPHSGALERAVRVAETEPEVFACIGTHPHDASLYNEAAEKRIQKLFGQHEKILAWGEIGLDYYYEHSPRTVQREVFARQLHSAIELGAPVVIHSRAADADTIDLLRREYGKHEKAGIMHCFGGGPELAKAALDLGFLISFAGNVTFKNACNLREVARAIPLERLLLETDCPYLTPAPYRGKRNEPAYVAETAAFLAQLRGVPQEDLARHTTENFARFFRLSLATRKTTQVDPA